MKRKEVKNIIRESLNIEEDNLNEAYLANPKNYSLNTEMLLSKTKEAHKDLYKKYINNFNDSSAKLDSFTRNKDEGRDEEFRSIKLNEQYNMNAIYLHELYFANISDPYSEIHVDSLAHMRLTRDFGSFDAWQKDFRACAKASRNGWVVTVLSTYLKKYINMVIDDHASNMLFGIYPVICLDMWEHARRDYLNDKDKYITTMMLELNWNIIEERMKRSELVYQALTSGEGVNKWV